MSEKYTKTRCLCGKIAFVKDVLWHKNKTPCYECYMKMVEKMNQESKEEKRWDRRWCGGYADNGLADNARDSVRWKEIMKDLKQILATCKKGMIDSGEDGFACILATQGTILRVIFSWGLGWEHASVSLPWRCPTWQEMCFVKDTFWRLDECVVQFHPPQENYVNDNNNCLHLWRPIKEQILMPPQICV